MPRYQFTLKDLAPLRRILDRPDVQRIMSRAIPVKRFDAPPAAIEASFESLPIRVRSRGNPGGVPLGDVNAMVKKRVPGVRSIIVRDNSLVVSWDEPPTDEARAQLKAALSDKKAFQELHEREAKPAAATEEQLRAELLAADTSDEQWLRAFRRFHTAQLAKQTPPKR